MRVIAIATVALIAISTSAFAEATADQPRAAGAVLLDVPFVPQSEALCGGAAVSMVMRYWASTSVYAEDFAALVDERAGGISVGALARAVGERGWHAHMFAATAEDVQTHVARGQPVVALIQDRPGRLHYVVVLAWVGNRVAFHDPAANPFRSMDTAAFDRAWRATGRTALLVLPPTAEVLASSERTDSAPVEGPRGQAGELFLSKRYGDAASLAALAVDQNPGDLEAWQLLAASRYLEGDAAAALDAWNRRQEPRVDLARVDGVARSRYDVVARALDLPPHTLLTRDALARAERRVAALPAVQASRVGYSPRENGLATVDVAVVERPLLPATGAEIIAATVYATTNREARLDVASPSGNGEVWSASVRWWSGRPRVGVALALPTVLGWTGRWQVEGAWERQTYAVASGVVQSNRRHAAVTFGDWWSGRTRYQLGAALDRWNDGATHVSLAGELERRFANDHIALVGSSAVTARFGTITVAARWRSSREEFTGIKAWSSFTTVSRAAPLDLWPGGDTGMARSTLLRAHPLIENGVIDSSRLARSLTHATVEYQRQLAIRAIARFGWAAFADVTPHEVDAGVGLRVKLPGAPGALRVDLARGLRDGRVALSAAWQPAW